jgi:hypothetical protein
VTSRRYKVRVSIDEHHASSPQRMPHAEAGAPLLAGAQHRETAPSSARLMESSNTALKSMGSPSRPALRPNGIATNPWGLLLMPGSQGDSE